MDLKEALERSPVLQMYNPEGRTVTRLRMMLINIPFKIISDCQALVYLSANKAKNPQIVRWNALLSEFNCEIEHRPGQKMAHVDALSRAPVDDVNEE